MGFLVCAGASLMCNFGMAPCALLVIPQNKVFAGTPAANIMDNKMGANIITFGMCTTQTNPAVAAATAAAMGTPTPAPCVPNLPAPWMPGSPTVQIGGMPALNDSSKLLCMYGGQISVTMPGQSTVTVP